MVLTLVFWRQVHEIAILYPAKRRRVCRAGKYMAFKFQFAVGQQRSLGILIGESDPVAMHVAALVAKMPGNEIEHGVDDAALQPKHGLGERKGMVDALHDGILVKKRADAMKERYHSRMIAENVHLKAPVFESIIQGVLLLVDVFTFRVTKRVPKTEIALVGLRALKSESGVGVRGQIIA